MDPLQKKTYVVIPTFNESQNILPLIQAILTETQPVRAKVLVVDDSSPDGTAQVVRNAYANNPWVEVMERKQDPGYGRSQRDGILYALNQGAELVLTMDADFSHDPKVIPAMVAASAKADMVIGSRYVGDANLIEGWSLHRKVLSKAAGTFISACCGVDVADRTSGFRLYRAELLRQMGVAEMESAGFAFLYEMLFWSGRLGAKIDEVPNVYRGRIHGESKLNPKIVFEAMTLLPRLRLKPLPLAAAK